jgi:predicted AAA+ superfamily ATPase
MDSFKIVVGGSFITFVEAALTRINYILPEILVEYNEASHEILIQRIGEYSNEDVKKEINYALYREKIYQETLPLRNKILGN